MKNRVVIALIILLITCIGLNAENIFNRYNLMSPMAMASGGFVSIIYNDSFNIYNNSSLLGIKDYSYYEFSFFKDSFDNYLFHISGVTEKKGLSPYNFGLKAFYNDFSDDDIDYKTFGVNPGISIRIMDKMFGGVSFLLMKNSFENMDNLMFMASFSFSYQIVEGGLASLYARNLGTDLTKFGNYSDSYYPDLGFMYSHRFPFPLVTQLALNYSEYNEIEASLSLAYLMRMNQIEIFPVVSLNYDKEFDVMNNLAYGLGLKMKSIMVEFGLKIVDSENLFCISLKTISL